MQIEQVHESFLRSLEHSIVHIAVVLIQGFGRIEDAIALMANIPRMNIVPMLIHCLRSAEFAIADVTGALISVMCVVIMLVHGANRAK